MRQVHYNGGMVVFSIPESWHEQTYPDGGASYFDGTGERGSLYVTLTTAQQQTEVTEHDLQEVANMGRGPEDAPAARLPSGNFVRRFERRGTENGVASHSTFWMVSNFVPPQTVRIASFNYGVPQSDAGTEGHRRIVTLLDEQIRQARFTTLTPEQVLGPQRAVRPWWQFW